MESSASAFVAQPTTTDMASTSATGALTAVTLRSILDKCRQNVSVRTSGVLRSASVPPHPLTTSRRPPTASSSPTRWPNPGQALRGVASSAAGANMGRTSHIGTVGGGFYIASDSAAVCTD